MVDDTHDSRDEEREKGKEEEQGEGRGERERQAGGGETTISRHFLLVAPRFKKVACEAESEGGSEESRPAAAALPAVAKAVKHAAVS